MINTFEEFARVDVYTGDIDPVYFAIARAYEEWGTWASRFAVAMLAYYHTGTAAKAAEYKDEEFWQFLGDQYPTAPRAAERRHFRGVAGMEALRTMKNWNPQPDTWFWGFPQTYAGVKAICESKLSNFGPYFQLKICDYMGCLKIPVRSFDGLSRNLPTLPGKAAVLLFPHLKESYAFDMACEILKPLNLPAPPFYDRPIGPAEVETILCDWKRAKYGSHWVGDDILDKRISLQGTTERGAQMANWMPSLVAKDTFTLDLL